MRKETWKTDITDKQYLPIEVYKFVFEQAQLRLSTLIEDGIHITNRCYALIGILIPIISLLGASIIKTSSNFTCESIPLIGLILIALLSSLTCLNLIYKCIKPRKEKYVGIEPKDIFIKNQLEFESGFSSENMIKEMYYNEMENLQSRISKTAQSNNERVKTFNNGLNTMIFSIVIALTIIVYLIIFL